MIVVIDNYDSFTYNLVQYLGELGAEVQVFRNDEVTLAEIEALQPTHIVISPGPGDPTTAASATRSSVPWARRSQCSASAWAPVHRPRLRRQGLARAAADARQDQQRLPPGSRPLCRRAQPLSRHALPLAHRRGAAARLPEVIAFTRDGEVMAVRHRDFPVVGVQFHPESILTEHGKRLLQNFLDGRTVDNAP
jgi:anthranilate/para-aminobenzoate synthase component II